MRFLLDSHILVWMHQEPDKLSKQAKIILEDVSNTLYISYASIWELQGKISAGRLGFEGGLMMRIRREQQDNGVLVLPIMLSHLEYLAKIPFYREHTDPFDRMLIAQATAENMTLVSADHKMHQFNYNITVLWD